MIILIPYLVLVLYLISVAMILLTIDQNFTFFSKQFRKASRLNVRLREKYQNHELNQAMKSVGLPINFYHYQLFRLSLLIFSAMSLVIQRVVSGDLSPLKIVLLFVIYVITMPVEKIVGFRSPFHRVMDLFQQRKRGQYNEELYLAIAQLKNGFLVRKDKPASSQYVLEEIRVYTNKTRHIFNRFMNFWVMGDHEQAIEYFDKEIGTKEARNLSQVFAKLDSLNPSEMRDQLDAYQSIYRAERETNKKKKNEVKSNILFFCVLATALMLLLNFIVVGYFIDFLTSLTEFI